MLYTSSESSGGIVLCERFRPAFRHSKKCQPLVKSSRVLHFTITYSLFATNYSSGVTGFDRKFNVPACDAEANELQYNRSIFKCEQSSTGSSVAYPGGRLAARLRSRSLSAVSTRLIMRSACEASSFS